MLPESVLRTAQAEMLEYGSSGQSVMEMSHRSSVYDAIIKETEAALRRVLCIPDNYKVGFIQGGASTQFAMVPMNLMTTGEADYLVTGQFSSKAAKEAEKFGRVNVPASSKDKNFTYIPDVDAVEYSKTPAISTFVKTTPFTARALQSCPMRTVCRWWPIYPAASSAVPQTSPNTG